MKRQDFRFAERMRVRWAEIDSQKIVFNAHYLMYFDTAVAGFWRAMAMPYHQTMEALQGDIFVRKASVEYFGSARYDDIIDVGMRCTRVGNSSMLFEGGVFNGETLLVSGELVYVFADPATQTSRPVPPPLRAAFEAFEAGEPMSRVILGPWAAVSDQAHPLRKQVFIEEQKIPAELEWDAADNTAVHAVALNRFDLPLATGRLVDLGEGVGKIGRMAVMRDVRGGRIGRTVLDALVQAAREKGLKRVILHAQQTAVGFYLRAGFSALGPVFEEAGIPHQEMVRDL